MGGRRGAGGAWGRGLAGAWRDGRDIDSLVLLDDHHTMSFFQLKPPPRFILDTVTHPLISYYLVQVHLLASQSHMIVTNAVDKRIVQDGEEHDHAAGIKMCLG